MGGILKMQGKNQSRSEPKHCFGRFLRPHMEVRAGTVNKDVLMKKHKPGKGVLSPFTPPSPQEREKYSPPPSIMILHRQPIKILPIIGLCDIPIRYMLVTPAQLPLLPFETKPEYLTELKVGAVLPGAKFC